MFKSWNNVEEWTNDIPINFLPFFVWCTANKVKATLEEEVFYKEYNNFIKAFSKTNINLESWCWEQFTHYYECNH